MKFFRGKLEDIYGEDDRNMIPFRAFDDVIIACERCGQETYLNEVNICQDCYEINPDWYNEQEDDVIFDKGYEE